MRWRVGTHWTGSAARFARWAARPAAAAAPAAAPAPAAPRRPSAGAAVPPASGPPPAPPAASRPPVAEWGPADAEESMCQFHNFPASCHCAIGGTHCPFLMQCSPPK